MIRKLFIYSGVAMLASLCCIAGAAALIRHQVDTTGWSWTMVKDGNHMRYINGGNAKIEPSVTKALTWTGGDLLAVDFPADVVFTQGPVASVSISGPQSQLDRIKLENGRLSRLDRGDTQETVRVSWTKDGWDTQSNDQGIKITITAPSVKRFEMTGNGDLKVRGYDQTTLDLTLSGSGNINVVGKTNAVKLNLSGSGDAQLAALQAITADVMVSGEGDVDLNASDYAAIDVSGNGDVTLSRKPNKLKTHISGTGSIDDVHRDEDGGDDSDRNSDEVPAAVSQ